MTLNLWQGIRSAERFNFVLAIADFAQGYKISFEIKCKPRLMRTEMPHPLAPDIWLTEILRVDAHMIARLNTANWDDDSDDDNGDNGDDNEDDNSDNEMECETPTRPFKISKIM